MTRKEAFDNLYARNKQAFYKVKDEEGIALAAADGSNVRAAYDRFSAVLDAYRAIELLTRDELELIRHKICIRLFG